jgi:hypothetical protein
MHLRKRGWEGMHWIYPAQNRNQRGAVLNTVMNTWGP